MAHFAKMVDMAKTPEQINKEVTERMPPGMGGTTAIADDLPKYPYGLCITLENEQLEKLGIEADCEVGDMIHLCAMAKVTSISKREKEGGDYNRIELQITHLASENEDEENEMPKSSEERAAKRYGGGEDEDGEE